MFEPIAIPALDSNYIWLLPVGDAPDAGKHDVYLIDPGDAAPAVAALEERSLTLKAVLITHHHWDHTDGLDALLAKYPVPVYGPDSVPQITHRVAEGDQLTLPGLTLSVLAVPGHTLDHLAYFYAPDTQGEPPRVFCGDALFAAGCGRLFEGTPAQALESVQKLNTLPDDTLIYCAHEYTHTNLRFARSVDPHNTAIPERLTRVEQQRAKQTPSLPTELTLERATNPFLRTQVTGIRTTIGLSEEADDAEVFAELRRRKDRFQ
ncbi:hydroxyacylglutathione hydrolase [Marinimicrobium agarilyticum]|uniref:hydroxyacylglutathione hydrolase n=1 Tax=Marinimicrobium agarilyticum TaxID=306546 RepID=UPI00040673C6|nr:hydroxyacylglutathione hydrolase [Marinimicrobium agarilyticum]